MKEIYTFLNYKKYAGLQDYELTFARENLELLAYSVIGLLVPFLIAQPQFLVGSVVNAALVLGALNIRGVKILPIILLPSIGVLLAGAIFGGLTFALIYMMPLIWIGNSVLVLSIKELVLARKTNRLLALLIGSGLKSALLFAGASALFYFGFVPAVLLGAMGIMQLQTALLGGGAAFLIHDAKKRFLKN